MNMPLKRTPPSQFSTTSEKLTLDGCSTPKMTNIEKFNLTNLASQPTGSYDSEPDEQNASMQQIELGGPRRTHKRRALGTPPKTAPARDDNVMIEMRQLFKSLSAEQESRFRNLESKIAQQNDEIIQSLDFLSSKYDGAIQQIHALEYENKESKKLISAMQDRIELLEKKERASGIEVRNIPRVTTDGNSYETKKDLCGVLNTLGSAIGTVISESDIRDIYRAKPANGTLGAVVVQFSTVTIKDTVMRSVKEFNKDKPISEKLNTGLLGYGDKRPIYMSEILTRKTARLFFLARGIAKAKNFKTWIYRGTVFIRTSSNTRIEIDSEEDLEKIKNLA